MRYIVTGIVLLLALITGEVSYFTLFCYEEDSSVTEKTKEGQNKASLVAIASRFLRQKRKKEWMFVAIFSMLCATVTFVTYNEKILLLEICKSTTVLLMLLAAAIIDSRTRLIPNIIVAIPLLLGAVWLLLDFVLYRESFRSNIVISFAGLISCVVLFYVLARMTKDGMGMGDVKLIAVTGWLVGLTSTIMIVLLALIACSVTAIILLIRKKKNKNDSVPFGPFLFFGYIVMILIFGI